MQLNNIITIITVQVDNYTFQYTPDGYINISKLCIPFGVKAYKLLNRNSVKDYVTKLQSSKSTPVVIKQTGGKVSNQGFYCVPELSLYISSLMSEELYKVTQSFIETQLQTKLVPQDKPVALTVTKSLIVEVNGYSFQYRQDDYINLTKMCKQASKELRRFLEQSDTKERLIALEELLLKDVEQSEVGKTGIPVVDKIQLIQKRVGGTPTEQGTYGHPIVAILLAQWLSPEFAVATAKLMQSYLKADVTLATDILDRATPEQVNAQGQQLANVLVEKADEKTEGHIQARLNTKNTNRELNRALDDCPNVSRAVFSMAQDSIYKATYNKTIKSLKKEKGLVKKDDSIRDTLTTKELVHLAFCEAMSTDVLDSTKPSGDVNCSKSVYDTSKQVKDFAKRLVKAGNSK